MRIAIDIMGGDFAPEAIIEGALKAATIDSSRQIILVGKSEVLQTVGSLPTNVSTVQAASVMGMDESVENLTGKKDSSIWLATKLVKDGAADAVVSAGSTAAQMASAFLLLGRIPGIRRPAIATVVPTMAGGRILLDVGANADSTPEMLLQFALMGDVYAKVVLGVERPEVALLSNGQEDSKGNNLTVAAHQLIAAADLNFIGNLEGRNLTKGNYHVLVTDGFTGNVALKVLEGTASTLFTMIKREITSNIGRKIGAGLIKGGLKEVKNQLDYAEYGGAPLVGVKGISIICHGSSNSKAIKNAIKVAEQCYKSDFVKQISLALEKNKAAKTEKE